MALAVDATIEALVAHALEQRADVVEALIYAELERRVGAIVEERLNGAAERPSNATNGPAPTLVSDALTLAGRKTCTICGQEKDAGQFDRQRHQCKSCRSRRFPRRKSAAAAADAEEAPRPGSE